MKTTAPAMLTAPLPRIAAAPEPPVSKRPPWASPELDQRIVEALVANDAKLLVELARRGVTEASVRAHARTLGMTLEFIKRCRLTGSRPAMRACMRCDERFLSAGIDNRLCRRCFRR